MAAVVFAGLPGLTAVFFASGLAAAVFAGLPGLPAVLTVFPAAAFAGLTAAFLAAGPAGFAFAAVFAGLTDLVTFAILFPPGVFMQLLYNNRRFLLFQQADKSEFEKLYSLFQKLKFWESIEDLVESVLDRTLELCFVSGPVSGFSGRFFRRERRGGIFAEQP
ncbi:MAG: hypothetical protein LBH35_02230 [Treponema sp.]|nr:hypothetical protein [Treponema sp.]